MSKRTIQNAIVTVVLGGIAFLVAAAVTFQGRPGSNVTSDIAITDWISAIGSAVVAISSAGALLQSA